MENSARQSKNEFNAQNLVYQLCPAINPFLQISGFIVASFISDTYLCSRISLIKSESQSMRRV